MMEYKGNPYKSFEDLARKLDVNSSTIRSRMNAGHTLEEAIEMGTKEIEYKGESYKSFEDLARKVGVHSATIKSRMNAGHSLEEAIELGPKEEIQIFHNVFKTLKELTDYYGLDYNTFAARLSMGGTHEEVLTYMLTKEKITFGEKEYKTLADLCNEYGMDALRVRHRISKGHSLREAVTRPIRQTNTSNSYTFRAKTYHTKRELAESYGLQQSFVSNFSRNQELDFVESLEALVTFLDEYEGERPTLISRIPAVIYNGIWYNTLSDFYAVIGTNNVQVSNFMKRYQIENYFTAMVEMKKFAIPKWIDVATGEPMSLASLSSKYKTAKVEEMGYAKQELVYLYDTINFHPTGYCALPLSDFQVYVENMKI